MLFLRTTNANCLFTRRRFLAGIAAGTAGTLLPAVLRGDETDRELRFTVRNEFGDAPVSNIEALLKSAAGELWRHCPQTKFLGRGFVVYHNKSTPITHFRLEEERIVIGLNTGGLYWAQYAYQFAHEFGHCLIDHTHDDQRRWHIGPHANLWLDECLCETASLFTLRAMGKSWKSQPPYVNWKGFAEKLTHYAQQRLDDPQHRLPEDKSFTDWFAQELPGLREQPTQRAKNTLIAAQFLPLFEAEPTGWESLTAIKRGVLDPKKPLVEHLREWQANATEASRPFVGKLTRLLVPA